MTLAGLDVAFGQQFSGGTQSPLRGKTKHTCRAGNDGGPVATALFVANPSQQARHPFLPPPPPKLEAADGEANRSCGGVEAQCTDIMREPDRHIDPTIRSWLVHPDLDRQRLRLAGSVVQVEAWCDDPPLIRREPPRQSIPACFQDRRGTIHARDPKPRLACRSLPDHRPLG